MITDLELSHPLFMFKLRFLWYNETMTIINQFVTLASHLVFIGLSYQMLISLFALYQYCLRLPYQLLCSGGFSFWAEYG